MRGYQFTRERGDCSYCTSGGERNTLCPLHYAEETGLYVLRWYGLSGYGPDGLRKCVDALKLLFAPGTAFTLSDGTTVRVRADIGPWAGEVRRIDGGWAVCTLTIPWLARSTNQVAA